MIERVLERKECHEMFNFVLLKGITKLNTFSFTTVPKLEISESKAVSPCEVPDQMWLPSCVW